MAGRRGQSMVEMAVVLPALVILLVIIVDFARAYQVALAVSSAARVGAEFGATQGMFSYRPTASEVCAVARNDMGNVYQGGVTEILLYPNGWPPPARGEAIIVRVKTRFFPITPLAGTFMPGGLTISREAQLWRNIEQPNGTLGAAPATPPADASMYNCP